MAVMGGRMVKFKVDVYSHGVRIQVHYPNEREAILKYCERLAIFETVWIPKLKRRVKKTKAVFATATHDRKEFGFLKAEFTKVEEYLRVLGYTSSDFQYTYHEPIEGAPIEIALQKGVGPRNEEQELAMAFMKEGKAINRVLNLPTGFGKAQPLSSQVLTPHGWVKMGDLSVGDPISGPDGGEGVVVGVYPQGVRPVYCITLEDGRQSTADAEHLWYTMEKGLTGEVLTTAIIKDRVENGREQYLPIHVPDSDYLEMSRVIDVQYVGADEVQCIEVSHPSHLYVTDDFIVTHNTACGLMTTAHYKVRTAFVMASGHFKTWIDSTKWVLDIDHAKDICVIQGREHLVNLVKLSLAGQNEYKLIFISIATIRAFLKDYLTEGYTIEGVTPYELFPTLGVGMRIVDESHENIHALVTATTFTHVRRAIYLSATLVSEDEKINNQYLKIFPMEDRFKDVSQNEHAKCISVTYRLEHPDKVKCTGTKGYSHVTYEQWLMANRTAETRYYEFIESLAEQAFVSDYQDEQKLLIFCATTEMCERLANRLSKLYPQFKTSAYTATYAPEVLYTNDIIVSTPTSAGTGKDIPNLRACISTVAIGSVQRNLQLLGRLRPIKKYPHIAPVYYWLTCLDIQQHREYDVRKREQFSGKCASIGDMPTNVVV
jgi:hypothetical protein